MDWYFFSIVDRRTFIVGVNSPESMVNSCSRKAIFLTFSNGARSCVRCSISSIASSYISCLYMSSEDGRRADLGSGVSGKCIVIGDDQGGYEVAVVADHNHIFDIWNQFQPVFNRLGSNIFSAGCDDDVLFPIGNFQETVRIDLADVSRVKPASG